MINVRKFCAWSDVSKVLQMRERRGHVYQNYHSWVEFVHNVQECYKGVDNFRDYYDYLYNIIGGVLYVSVYASPHDNFDNLYNDMGLNRRARLFS